MYVRNINGYSPNIIFQSKNNVQNCYIEQMEKAGIDTIYDSDLYTPENISIIAHRGAKDTPENTIPSLMSAIEAGCKTIECDVRFTKDGIPVILHDKTINRTARKENGSRLIIPRFCSRMTYDELLQYDFGIKEGEEYKGTKIPTLDEYIECAKENNVDLYIELKDDIGLDDKRAQELLDKVHKAGLDDNVSWISFNSDYLKIIKDLNPNARLGYLTRKSPNEKTIDILESLKNEENEVFLDIKSSKIDEKSSRYINNAGFDFETWTVNNYSEYSRLITLNCSAITSDFLYNNTLSE